MLFATSILICGNSAESLALEPCRMKTDAEDGVAPCRNKSFFGRTT